MKKLSFLIILLLTSATGKAQVKELILGRWDLVETIKDTTNTFELPLEFRTDDPEDVEKTDKTDTLTVFFFAKGGEFQDRYQGRQYRSDYRFLSDEIIIIGELTYQILTLSTEKLQLQLYEEDSIFPPSKDILVFQKSDKLYNLIKEYEPHVTYHDNGQKREEGQFHNGIENGVWRVWYPNGQLKSEKEFKDGIPVGIWTTWNEQGKLVKRVNKDIF